MDGRCGRSGKLCERGGLVGDLELPHAAHTLAVSALQFRFQSDGALFRGPREGEVHLSRTEAGDFRVLLCLVEHTFAALQPQGDGTLPWAFQIVDQNDWHLRGGGRPQVDLSHVDHQSDRCKRIADISVELGFPFEAGDFTFEPVVGCLAIRTGVAQRDEVHDGGALPVRAPELSGGSQPGGLHVEPLLRCRVFTEYIPVDVACERRRCPVPVNPMPAIFVIDDGVCAVAAPIVVGLRIRFRSGQFPHSEAGVELIRMLFAGVTGLSRSGIPVVPRSIGEVQVSDPQEGIAGFLAARFIAGVPNGHARMVPLLAQPLGVFQSQFIDGHRLRHIPAVPDREFVLNQNAFLIGDVIPAFRGQADAISDAVPMHLFDAPMELAHPVLVPWQRAALRILEEAIEGEVGAAHEIRLAIEHRSAGVGIEPKLAHPETRLEFVALRAHRDAVKERIFRRPQMAVLDWDGHVPFLDA